MGAMVKARCDCNYSAFAMVGGGMLNYSTYCGFPVYCRSCKQLHAANLLASPVLCPECDGGDVAPYDSSALTGEQGDEEVFSWYAGGMLGRIPCLTNGRYFCPACQQMRLRFELAPGSWD